MRKQLNGLIAANEELKREARKGVTTQQLEEAENKIREIAKKNLRQFKSEQDQKSKLAAMEREVEHLTKRETERENQLRANNARLEQAKQLHKAANLRNDQLEETLKEHTEASARLNPSTQALAGARDEWLPEGHRPASPNMNMRQECAAL